MQGQRSTVESFPEAFAFDHGSTPSSSAIDQQVYWNSMLNPVDGHNVPEYLLPSTDTNTSYANVVSRDYGSLNGWNLARPSSSGHALGQTNPDDSKMEEVWTSSLVSNSVTGPRSEERQLETANMLSLENVDISLNGNQSANGHLFLQNSNTNDAPQNSGHNAAFVGNSRHVSEAGGVGYLLEEDDGRPGGSLDGRRLSGKRKNIEGVSGQSSLSGSSSCFQQSENNLFHVVSSRHNSKGSLNISSSSASLSGANPSEEQLNPRSGTSLRGSARECHDLTSLVGNAENVQRNPRMRVNSAHQHDSSPNSWLSGNSIGHSNIWSPNQPSSLLIPFNQSDETTPAVAGTIAQSQSHASPFPGLTRSVHPFPWNGMSNSRIGNSSTSIAISGDRPATLREETSSRSITRNHPQDQPMLVPATDMRYLAQDPSNWSLSNGNLSIPGTAASTSRVGSSSTVQPSAIPTWASHQNPHSRYPLSLSEFTRRSFFPPAGSDSAVQSNNLLPQRSGHSASLQEMVPLPGTSLRGHQQSFLRSAFWMDRQNDGVLGVPLSLRTLAAASREGRSRVISEIRNALELMRRGENIRFEDVLILDQSVFYGGVDLHDRHRDMRLDVDNMSYEELLALEERIGYVSTGLNEEIILKCLKQRNYLPVTPEASVEVEPCCICQEEYIEGVYLGTLNCGHDFHTDCIKQWLMHKNLCPICKTTGLVA